MVGAVLAGPLEDANEALIRKDYAKAVRLYRPLAAAAIPTRKSISVTCLICCDVQYGKLEGIYKLSPRRVLWLTFLAPDIVKAIFVNGTRHS